ncbi:hypothetical protein ANO11243_019170 [Dothideomycetidae sp. 11243]|nr:hypothetical protein ANO11243_019170 [fungal sp. No.11243]
MIPLMRPSTDAVLEGGHSAILAPVSVTTCTPPRAAILAEGVREKIVAFAVQDWLRDRRAELGTVLRGDEALEDPPAFELPLNHISGKVCRMPALASLNQTFRRQTLANVLAFVRVTHVTWGRGGTKTVLYIWIEQCFGVAFFSYIRKLSFIPGPGTGSFLFVNRELGCHKRWRGVLHTYRMELRLQPQLSPPLSMEAYSWWHSLDDSPSTLFGWNQACDDYLKLRQQNLVDMAWRNERLLLYQGQDGGMYLMPDIIENLMVGVLAMGLKPYMVDPWDLEI